MPEVFTSAMVGAPAGEVWALLRDFASIGDWHPALSPCEIENGPADRVGSVRVYPLAGGHRETLVGLDDRKRTIAFTFADHAAGLPVRNYLSTMTVRPVTIGNHAYVEWSSRFDCDEPDEDKAAAQIRDGVLVPGLRAVEARFGTAGQAPGPAT
jgi:polyketide cyclase/dehydrase/lipid transport protein